MNESLSGKIIMPRIGAGFGKGHWHRILEIIEKSAPDLDLAIVEDTRRWY